MYRASVAFGSGALCAKAPALLKADSAKGAFQVITPVPAAMACITLSCRPRSKPGVHTHESRKRYGSVLRYYLLRLV